MGTPAIKDRLRAHLRVLVEEIGPRPAGSPANRRATDHVAAVLDAAGFEVRSLPFTTPWWEPAPSELHLPDGDVVELLANPFSRAGTVEGRVRVVEDLEALLADRDAAPGEVLVLGPALGGEPVMPATFPFLSIPEQRELVAGIEARRPAAVVAVSPAYASTPTFEDPTLGFPSLTVGPELAARLTPDARVRLVVRGQVHDGHGVNVSARAGAPDRPRLVLSAHVDSKVTTPGAFDNAASVAVLLTLAELAGPHLGPVEIVLFNGEDHHDNAGEQAWLAATDLAEVTTNVNLDGAGVAGRRTGLACLACPADLAALVGDWVAGRDGWTVMPPWFESDHAIFAMRGIPAIAITSEDVHDLLVDVAHMAADTLEVLDVAILVDLVDGLRDLLPRLGQRA